MAKQTICGETPISELARETIRRQRKKLRKSQRALHDGEATEAVHDMRIAIRKLRTTLQAFEELSLFDQRRVNRLRRALRRPGRLLGSVRDFDVLLARIDGDPKINKLDDAVMLHAALVRRRARAWKRLMRDLKARKTRRAIAQLKRFPRGYLSRDHVTTNGTSTHAHAAIGSVIWRLYEAIRSFEDVMPAAPPPLLHRVRIAAKHLRYALELFDQAEEPQWQSLLETLKEVQSTLGAQQDRVNALVILSSIHEKRPNNEAAAIAMQSAERDIEHADFAPLWSRLTSPDFRRQLASYIAAL